MSAAPVARLDRVWSEIVDRVDTPRVSLLERVLRRVGLNETDARLALSAASLRTAWALSLLLILGFAVAAAQTQRVGPDLFLLFAPVLPVLGVGVAYGPYVDPTYEWTLAAPYSSVRLILLRTGMVLGLSVLLSMVAALFLPRDGLPFLWLLPALALVAATLALSAWFPTALAALLISSLWLLAVSTIWVQDRSLEVVFGPGGQTAAAVAVVAASVFVIASRRSHAYDLRRLK